MFFPQFYQYLINVKTLNIFYFCKKKILIIRNIIIQ